VRLEEMVSLMMLIPGIAMQGAPRGHGNLDCNKNTDNYYQFNILQLLT